MSHRRAFGPQRIMSDATKARNIAHSITRRIAEQRAWTFSDYGISENAALVAAVQAELTKAAQRAA